MSQANGRMPNIGWSDVPSARRKRGTSPGYGALEKLIIHHGPLGWPMGSTPFTAIRVRACVNGRRGSGKMVRELTTTTSRMAVRSPIIDTESVQGSPVKKGRHFAGRAGTRRHRYNQLTEFM